LHFAAAAGNGDQITVLLEAGAPVTAVMNNSHTCLSLAASTGKTSAVQQLLQAWDAPADVLQHAVQQAARSRQWDAVVKLIRHLGGQDRHAAKALLAGMFDAGNPAAALALQDSLLTSWLDSETEQQRAALKQEAQQVSRQRAGLQQLLIGVAATHSRIEAARGASSAAAAAGNMEQAEPRMQTAASEQPLLRQQHM
jgi:hypothetical protein